MDKGRGGNARTDGQVVTSGTPIIEQLRGIFADIVGDFPDLQLAYLFGSRLEENLGPLSDYDIAVVFDRVPLIHHRIAHITHSLAKKLDTTYLDVVDLHDAPIELQFSVISKGALIYERDVPCRVEYEARVMGLYFDFLPVLRAARKEIVEGDEHAARVQRYRKALRRTQRTLSQIRTDQGQAPEGF